MFDRNAYDRQYYQKNKEKIKKRKRKDVLNYYHRNKDEILQKRRQYYWKIRKKIWEYLLEHPCVDCGEKDPVVLDFDHVRGQKKYSPRNVKTRTWKTMLKEIAKCEIRCANCHRKKHFAGCFDKFNG